jgi:hypothetical protein
MSGNKAQPLDAFETEAYRRIREYLYDTDRPPGLFGTWHGVNYREPLARIPQGKKEIWGEAESWLPRLENQIREKFCNQYRRLPPEGLENSRRLEWRRNDHLRSLVLYLVVDTIKAEERSSVKVDLIGCERALGMWKPRKRVKPCACGGRHRGTVHSQIPPSTQSAGQRSEVSADSLKSIAVSDTPTTSPKSIAEESMGATDSICPTSKVTKDVNTQTPREEFNDPWDSDNYEATLSALLH